MRLPMMTPIAKGLPLASLLRFFKLQMQSLARAHQARALCPRAQFGTLSRPALRRPVLSVRAQDQASVEAAEQVGWEKLSGRSQCRTYSSLHVAWRRNRAENS